MSKLNKLTKVGDNFTVNRYDNGWMVEVGGRNKKDDCVTAKVMCITEQELLEIIKEYNAMELYD